MPEIEFADVTADVVLKDVKNIHLSVYPPDGDVRIAAPTHMDMDVIRVFAISKLPWIRREQKKLREQRRESKRAYLPQESHYVWGERCLLNIEEHHGPSMVSCQPGQLTLHLKKKSTQEQVAKTLEDWYRAQVKAAVPALLDKWEPRLGVKVEGFYVRRMKTKWGSCNHEKKTIRLNSELAKKSPEFLEYIVVHEMAHIIEPTHNRRFIKLLNEHFPRWQFCRDELNRAPLSYVEWGKQTE